MGHSIGDGLIVLALAAAFLGYLYLKYLAKARRLEILHAERLVAMDKGIPLPELPLDPPAVEKRADPRVPLVMGIVFTAFGAGGMIAMGLIPEIAQRGLWPLPLPLALVGLGLVLYYFLPGQREQ